MQVGFLWTGLVLMGCFQVGDEISFKIGIFKMWFYGIYWWFIYLYFIDGVLLYGMTIVLTRLGCSLRRAERRDTN